MLGVELEPVALGGVRDDDPVAGQLLHAQQVVHGLRVLDPADVVEVGELRDQLRRQRVAGVHRVEQEHRQRRRRGERLVPRPHELRRRGSAGSTGSSRCRSRRRSRAACSHSRDGVRKRVVSHLRHHRHAAADRARDDLVHALALGHGERPELAHDAAAEDAVDLEAVDVVLDGAPRARPRPR